MRKLFILHANIWWIELFVLDSNTLNYLNEWLMLNKILVLNDNISNCVQKKKKKIGTGTFKNKDAFELFAYKSYI